MKSFKSYLLKEDIKDILLSDYKNKEMLLDEILDEYLFLINDIRKDEQEDIIVKMLELFEVDGIVFSYGKYWSILNDDRFD